MSWRVVRNLWLAVVAGIALQWVLSVMQLAWFTGHGASQKLVVDTMWTLLRVTDVLNGVLVAGLLVVITGAARRENRGALATFLWALGFAVVLMPLIALVVRFAYEPLAFAWRPGGMDPGFGREPFGKHYLLGRAAQSLLFALPFALWRAWQSRRTTPDRLVPA